MIELLAVLSYGCPPHPMIVQREDGRWYCTECSALVG